MRFINSSGENITLRKFYLRVANSDVESYPVVTGEARTGQVIEAALVVVLPLHKTNFVMGNWKDFRSLLGAYKLLVPSEVLAGSAAFVSNISDVRELDKLKKIEIVAVDFSGNETTTAVEITPDMIKWAKIPSFVLDKAFEIDGTTGVITLK